MSYKIRRSLYQVTIKLMLVSLIAASLAGLISPPLVGSVASVPQMVNPMGAIRG